jgi:hypothetical protein
MVCKSSSVLKLFNLNRSDGKEARQVMEQTANDVDQVKRSYHLTSSALTEELYSSFQKSNCARASTTGSPRRIRRLIIILPVKLIIGNPQCGSSRETFTRNGNQKDPSFGSTESVRPVLIFHPIPPHDALTL